MRGFDDKILRSDKAGFEPLDQRIERGDQGHQFRRGLCLNRAQIARSAAGHSTGHTIKRGKRTVSGP